MKKMLLGELKEQKQPKGHDATNLMRAKHPKDQPHGKDTKAKILMGIHKRTHMATK